MKSYNPSFPQFRRTVAAVAILLATGTSAVLAQSTETGGTSAQTNSSADYNNAANPNASATESTNAETSNMQSSASDSTMNENNPANSSDQKLSWSDRHFINKTAEDNQKEIQLAQLGVDHASNPDVKNYAQKLLQDHQQMAQDLQNVAQQDGVQLKTKSNTEDHTYKKLASASGNEFDSQFVKHMVNDHKKDVKEFKDRADDTKNPALKSFVENQIPTLQQHLQMAQNLQSSIVPTGRMDQNSGRGNMSTGTSSTNLNMTGNTTEAAPSTESTGSTGYSSGANSGTSTSSTGSTP